MYTPKYFTLKEFIRSSTAERLKIDNTPSFTVVNNLLRLCALVLDDARMKLDRPIIVNSGYRCIELNRRVGGVYNSQHLTGLACDISCSDNRLLFDILAGNPNIDQLLYEHSGKSTWIHVSITRYGGTPRRYINDNYRV